MNMNRGTRPVPPTSGYEVLCKLEAETRQKTKTIVLLGPLAPDGRYLLRPFAPPSPFQDTVLYKDVNREEQNG